ncbi:MAG: hypothetical protein DHS20C03_21030 [Minwuia thermotolerans]|nr:MAG: hypothetical protein DHS20C03_21030 [Minwuia thermotolerans]
MVWYIFSILLIILFLLFVHRFILDFVDFEFSSYLGGVVVDIFGDEFFVKELKVSEISRIDGRSVVFVFGILVLGLVILPVLAMYIISRQVVFSIIAMVVIIFFLGYFVDDIVSYRIVDSAISSLIEVLGNKLFGLWMLVLSLIVFVRSWRKLQAAV